MFRLSATRGTRAVAVAAAIATGSFLTAGSASAQANCQWYAATSLKQQQQNEKLRCGFRGPEWHTDLGRHLSWCGSVPPDVWRRSAQARDQMLARCAAKAR